MDLLEHYKSKTEEDLKRIKPHWHRRKEDIDFKANPSDVATELLNSGFELYETPISELLKSMPQGLKEVYERTPLWNDSEDGEDLYHEEEKLARILDHWSKDIALIPAAFIPNGFGQLAFQDGHHRLKIAVFLGCVTIPIILYNHSLPKLPKSFRPTRIT